ncbi:Crp/Fnr family transcriptional regulator [Flavihumibacter fluvii]|uniref:Crp/Fnr family transcriptional regulator n=1 Tax=Flavihumibacter fluvii TaxID=2838157 RepID=UPI001BDDDF8E|nr:Crp/Fnr family transcriptional regulator [Flavihumibacter fluvii]ULQ54238.1 Crp/Fnr family transcriptional regulator [Flavihumibacter fluvii]
MEHQLLLSSFRQYINLTAEEEQEVLQYITPRNFKRGEFINVEGEVNRYTNFIVSGSSRVYYIDNDGQEHVVQLGISGWWVGDFPSFIMQTPATMYTEALEKTSILAFNFDKLQLVYDRIPKIERFFRLLIQKAYAAFHKRTLQSLSMDAEQRYLAFAAAYPEMDQQVSAKYIASYLGMSPEFLSTIKKRIVVKQREKRKNIK